MQQLVNKKYLLQKMAVKGGWTYLLISEIPKESRGRHGALKVSGKIDDFTLTEINLMPLKTGELFMPVNAQIRRAINKQVGDWVHLELNTTQHEQPEILSDEEMLILCLKDEPQAYENFIRYENADQVAFINWIAETKNQDVKAERIAKCIDLLANKQTLKKH